MTEGPKEPEYIPTPEERRQNREIARGASPGSGGSSGMNWWRQRSTRVKVAIIAGVIIVIAVIAAAAGGGGGGTKQTRVTVTETVQTTAETGTTTEQSQPVQPAVERPPKPVILRGQGARVETFNIARDSPLVVTAVHRGAANFILELVGSGDSQLLVNTIGNYSGAVAYADAAAGRYRMKVEADGAWTIWLTQPVPSASAKLIPGTVSGRGPTVIRIRTEEDLQPIADVTHRGQANFIVELIGYGDNTGSQLLINQIGNYSGQTLVDDMPKGGYLLAVQADGLWSVRFTP
jgi:hypothetical protein